MKITGIIISQFKGIMSLSETNLQDIVNISGDNECGKTTIASLYAKSFGAQLISFSAVIYQTYKAARANPVDSLRYE